MRRLSLLLCALLLTLATSVPHLMTAKPVHAATTACESDPNDLEETVYTDWHSNGGTIVQDSYPFGPSSHLVGIDLWSWRISHRPIGTSIAHCWRAYYASAATNDGTPANFTARLSVWICGQAGFAFNTAEQWAGRTDAVTADASWGINGNPNLLEDVTLPSGVTRTLWFADYGAFPIENGCLPQAWTDGFRAASGTWTPTVLLSSPSSTWFCHDRDGIAGRNFYCP